MFDAVISRSGILKVQEREALVSFAEIFRGLRGQGLGELRKDESRLRHIRVTLQGRGSGQMIT